MISIFYYNGCCFYYLSDPYNEENQNEDKSKLIDIDLGQSAFGNAQR